MHYKRLISLMIFFLCVLKHYKKSVCLKIFGTHTQTIVGNVQWESNRYTRVSILKSFPCCTFIVPSCMKHCSKFRMAIHVPSCLKHCSKFRMTIHVPSCMKHCSKFRMAIHVSSCMKHYSKFRMTIHVQVTVQWRHH